ncbi:MAG TPA: hypothetical protein VFQ26_08345 [Nitrospiraceae bacterium]|nr:hypothetical protein [Nitrospiraceae bacterium]
MQFKKQLIFVFLVFMIGTGIAWAGERGYQLVVGRDSKLCARVLEVFREDTDDRGRLRYQHEIFRQIVWKPVELKGQGPKARHCSSLNQAMLDLDNDGQSDLVIKSTFCMKGSPSDSFYKFPAESAILEQANWQDLSPLLATPDKFERTGGAYPLTQLPIQETGVSPATLIGVFTVQPFMLDGSAYVSLTDARAEWTVIAKYLRGEQFEDQCYLRMASR